MKRAIISVGVNTYDFADQLTGAEQDARQIFEELIKPEIGQYDAEQSRLLLSPTLGQLRDTVEQVVLGGTKLEELTFFFAGHGLTLPTGFYMALRDTRVNRVTATAYGLSEFFTHIDAAAPTHTNIILDACFSGGLAADLSMLTRAETSGYVGSPAVTLLAMSARNQEAGEIADGGIGTLALLDCITGRALVREDVAELALIDIAPVVSHRVGRQGSQNPVFSALNVHRRSSFCRNVLFQASADSALKNWNARSFLDAIEPVLASHAHSPTDLITDIERLFNPLIEKASSSRDVFKAAEVRGAAIIALMPYLTRHDEIKAWSLESIAALSDDLHSRVGNTVSAFEDNRFAMLAGPEGLANLFLLPIRLSKLLGWTGAAFHLDRFLGREELYPREEFATLLRLTLDSYCLSLAAMSDTQAPYIAVALTAAHSLGLEEEGEVILSSTFHDLLLCGANVADAHIKSSQILSYLEARSNGSFADVRGMVAQPTELGAVLLILSKLFAIDDVFDEVMSNIDHVNINAFVPDDYKQFSQKIINDGENNTFSIGNDIWTVNDLFQSWPMHSFIPPSDASLACSAILAALIFPDRVPWFVFQNLSHAQDEIK